MRVFVARKPGRQVDIWAIMRLKYLSRPAKELLGLEPATTDLTLSIRDLTTVSAADTASHIWNI